MFQVVKNSPKPLGDQLVEEVTALIECGRLTEGFRLPSVRELARRSGVSVYTASAAFDRLHARGLIESRRGSGYFVARQRRYLETASIELGPPPSADPVLGFTRSSLGAPHVAVPAGCGFLPASWFADAILPSMFSKFGRAAAAAMPAPIQGDPQLLDLLVEKLHVAGIPAAPRNVVVTFGASQAFDLIARSVLAPGDTVLVDDPGYFVLPSQLRAHRVHIVPVPRLADGSALDVLEEVVRLHRPKIFFTQTLLHNPTGTTASAANCHGVLKIADKYNFLIVEDHVYSDLGPPHLMSLAQIDELRRVIYVGSFSKVLSPGIRIGFAAAPDGLIRQLIEAKILTALTGSALDEFIVREVLASGKYRKYIGRLRDRLTKARSFTIRMLRTAGLTAENPADGGLFLWAQLPTSVEAVALAQEARGAGILLAPGSMFSLSGGANDRLRFNAAYGTDPSLVQFLSERCKGRA
ncbi:MAG TPA: PLP-dependent aminotransferase family protein [Steroidobacteraceae bacterium]